jgi:flagellar biosynthetic protein FlhB
MADQDIDRESRTEEATPRHRQEAREKGQVAFSMELLAALVLIGWLGALAFAGDRVAHALGAALEGALSSFGELGRGELTVASSAGLITGYAPSIASATLIVIAPLFALALLASYGQVGFVIAPKGIELDAGKLDPMRGFQRLFSMRSGVRTTLALAKMVAIAIALFAVAWQSRAQLAALTSQEIGPALAGFGSITLRCSAGAIAAVLALALIDVVYQRRQLSADLRMTKHEVREEIRTSEGDPHIKARIRRIQQETARRRMMAEVPRATVVITNPTHYAVALRYDRAGKPEERRAPRVVAKGVDLIAQRIKEIAREAGVAVYEEPPLARALYAQVEIGDEVPSELYQAVASVLAYVYGLPNSRATAGV